MSYAIVRNEKLTRTKAQGICVHCRYELCYCKK